MGAGDLGWLCGSATFILPIKLGADSPFAVKCAVKSRGKK